MKSCVRSLMALIALSVLLAGSSGCRTFSKPPVASIEAPRELDKVMHPTYVVEAPDILLIEAFKGVPKPPHKIEPLDVLGLQLADPVPMEPLQGLFTVDLDGTINLGTTYGGTVKVEGLTVPEAKVAIEKVLTTAKFKDPKIAVNLAQTRSVQRISGTHLVRADGTIGLGSYGSVSVTGKTLAEVKKAIEMHLSQYLRGPEVSVEVQGFNSKIIYVVLDGGGSGQTVVRLPCTGNETVLDAISQVNGLNSVSSTNRIWVARPAPAGAGPQILPVDWNAVVGQADTNTNYQLLPGDRVFVASQPMVRIDTYFGRAIAPVERLLGVLLLGSGTVRSLKGQNQNGIGNSGF